MAANDSGKTGFSRQERDAMNARARELAVEKRASRKRDAGEQQVRDAIAAMAETDKTMAEKIHEIVTATAPDLWPKTWYGMPAYARDGKVICFFQGAGKFDSRYATFGFNDTANLDDGNMWATAYALTQMTPAEEEKIKELVRKAVG